VFVELNAAYHKKAKTLHGPRILFGREMCFGTYIYLHSEFSRFNVMFLNQLIDTESRDFVFSKQRF